MSAPISNAMTVLLIARDAFALAGLVVLLGAVWTLLP